MCPVTCHGFSLCQQLQNDQGTHDEQKEMEVLQRRLQEQEEMVGQLQEQLETATGSLKEAEVQV